MTKLIKSKKEFEDFYYNGKHKPDQYPTKYPVIVTETLEDGGLGGSYKSYSFYYLPYNIFDIDSYVAGFIRGMDEAG